MNLTVLAILLLAVLWFVGAFFGFIGGVPKAFHNGADTRIDSTRTKSSMQESIESTEEKRQKLMDDMKQKISDQQHRY